ncbi:transcriptional regulator, partial [Rhodococcus sp. IEGM 248]|nr:transcriptional regulator [Rhodococcus sp. IEGM 248]
PEGQATVDIGPERIEACEDATVVDVTLTGEAEVLGAAMDPAQVPALVADGRLVIDGDPAAVRQLAKVFAPPRIRG